MEVILFYIVSAIALAGGLFFVCSKNPLYAILSLIVVMFSIAGLYILLNAQFLGIVQIIVYAGAIMVLFLYILMMLSLKEENESRKATWRMVLGAVSAGLLLVGLTGMLKGGSAGLINPHTSADVGLTKNLGKLLFNEYVLPFEIASVLILSGIVGAVFVGKKDL